MCTARTGTTTEDPPEALCAFPPSLALLGNAGRAALLRLVQRQWGALSTVREQPHHLNVRDLREFAVMLPHRLEIGRNLQAHHLVG